MNFKQSMILLLVGVFSAAVFAGDKEYDIDALIAMARADTNCVLPYVNYMNDVAESYNATLQGCHTTADKNVEKVQTQATETLGQLNNEASQSCNAVISCDSLQCVSTQGSQTSKILFDVNASAAKADAQVQEEIRVIENNKYICTNATTLELKAANDVGMKHLTQCLSTGQWTLTKEVPVEEAA